MKKLPVIVAQGGISSAGRTSGFNAYRRLVMELLSEKLQTQTALSLSQLTGISAEDRSQLAAATLIRALENERFDPTALPMHCDVQSNREITLAISKRKLPQSLPAGWRVAEVGKQQVEVTLPVGQSLMLPAFYNLTSQVAGQLPAGFHPEKTYPSRHHPRGLSMAVYGASDAFHSMGISRETLFKHISADQIAVYAGSCMSQLDYNGNGGLLQARLKGKRVTSKQLPLGFAEMTADFINAYVLGSLGSTGTNMGACATFLYNLRQGVDDIRSGRARVVIVGNSEAPITPEIIEGYSMMGALATDDALRDLDGLSADQLPDYRRACRPFAKNCGFVLAESAQFFVLMDDALAIETGAAILGSVGDVFVHADGYKKSISSPGVGNYITFAKAVAQAQQMMGGQSLTGRSFVQAHGTGTPQNRTTESKILSTVAKAFGIDAWPVTAVKSYVGHSLATAAGDQLMSTLGTWRHGYLPGITSIDEVAPDVNTKRLAIQRQHLSCSGEELQVALLNAKGFGGNNASVSVYSPAFTVSALKDRYGSAAIESWQKRHDAVEQTVADYESNMLQGNISPEYHFGKNILSDEAVSLTPDEIRLGDSVISLKTPYPLSD